MSSYSLVSYYMCFLFWVFFHWIFSKISTVCGTVHVIEALNRQYLINYLWFGILDQVMDQWRTPNHEPILV